LKEFTHPFHCFYCPALHNVVGFITWIKKSLPFSNASPDGRRDTDNNQDDPEKEPDEG